MTSHEIASADALLRENAELRKEIAYRARIDAEDMHRLQERYDHLYRQFESLQKWVARGITLQPPPPIYVDVNVPALLSELDAARALAAYLNDHRHWTAGICPTCGFGSKLDGSEFHGSGCVLAAYNATQKARNE